MQISEGKKIYFLSDFHLGAPDPETSLIREKRIVKFLDEIKNEATQIFILGDLFDFWYEYKRVVPKGFVRILGKLAELTDSGIEIHFFVGNHDMWMKGYFEKELNIKVHYHPEEFDLNGKKFFIGHGDGLGPKDHRYKFIKKVFRNNFSQWLFGILHPGFGIGIADYFSNKSRNATGKTDEVFLGEDKEWLIIFSRQMLQTKHYDYFIFGHRHLPIDFRLNDPEIDGTGISRYINLGDWIKYNSYAVFDGEKMELKFYPG
ncbi:MAG TPA: UDP-2,3-diacylglucosamine diphosphatase [Chitinophagaceae bacterium]|nr:UDP-2,3-diacylglucosamine diphosphatase [Chitinophagaceae bacterium]